MSNDVKCNEEQIDWLLGWKLFLKSAKYGKNNVLIILQNVKITKFPPQAGWNFPVITNTSRIRLDY